MREEKLSSVLNRTSKIDRFILSLLFLSISVVSAGADEINLNEGSNFVLSSVERFDGTSGLVRIGRLGATVEINLSDIESIRFERGSANLTLRDGSLYSAIEVIGYSDDGQRFQVQRLDKVVEIPALEVAEIDWSGSLAGDESIEGDRDPEPPPMAVEEIDKDQVGQAWAISDDWSDENLFSNAREFLLDPNNKDDTGLTKAYVPRWKGEGAKKTGESTEPESPRSRNPSISRVGKKDRPGRDSRAPKKRTSKGENLSDRAQANREPSRSHGRSSQDRSSRNSQENRKSLFGDRGVSQGYGNNANTGGGSYSTEGY